MGHARPAAKSRRVAARYIEKIEYFLSGFAIFDKFGAKVPIRLAREKSVMAKAHGL